MKLCLLQQERLIAEQRAQEQEAQRKRDNRLRAAWRVVCQRFECHNALLVSQSPGILKDVNGDIMNHPVELSLHDAKLRRKLIDQVLSSARPDIAADLQSAIAAISAEGGKL